MAEQQRAPPRRPPAGCPRDIADRVHAARESAGISVRQIAAQLWPALGDNARFMWYKKVGLRGSSFDWQELDQIRLILRAPWGWPYIDWEYAATLEKLEVRLQELVR